MSFPLNSCFFSYSPSAKIFLRRWIRRVGNVLFLIFTVPSKESSRIIRTHYNHNYISVLCDIAAEKIACHDKGHFYTCACMCTFKSWVTCMHLQQHAIQLSHFIFSKSSALDRNVEKGWIMFLTSMKLHNHTIYLCTTISFCFTISSILSFFIANSYFNWQIR